MNAAPPQRTAQLWFVVALVCLLLVPATLAFAAPRNGNGKGNGKTSPSPSASATSSPAPSTSTSPSPSPSPVTSSSPTASPSPASSPTTSPTPSPSPASGGTRKVYPEGVTIEVNTATSWTTDQVYTILKANTIDLSVIGPTLEVFVQDVYYSSTTGGAVCCTNGRYTDYVSRIYLDARPGTTFSSTPDAVLAHEYGHAWSLYHLYISQTGAWASYLQARGIAGDARLDTSYSWSKREIIADDYRLLFGSTAASTQPAQHLNPEITDPRLVPGLRDFLANVWTTAH